MNKSLLLILIVLLNSQMGFSETQEELELSLFDSPGEISAKNTNVSESSEQDLLDLFYDETPKAQTTSSSGEPTEEEIQNLFNQEIPSESPKNETADSDLLELLQEEPVTRPKNEDDVLAEMLAEEELDPGPLTKTDLQELKEVRRPILQKDEKEDFKEFKQSLYSLENQMGIRKKFSSWDLESIEVMDFVENKGLLYEDVINNQGLESIEKIHKIEKTGSRKYHPPKPIIPRKKDFFEPENYFGILKKNSRLENLKTKEYIWASRKIYVKARPIVVGGEKAYLLDKKNKKVYKTNIQNIISIQNEVDMKAKPSLYSEHVPRAQMEGDDTVLPLAHTFALYAEAIDPHYFESLFATNGANASSIKGDYRIYYKWDWPLLLGLNAGAERGNWNPKGVSLDWTGLFYGLSLNYPAFKFDGIEFEASLSFQKLALMKATVTGGGSVRFQGDSLSGNIQAIYKVPLGHIVLGLVVRETYLSVKESNRPLSQPNRKQSLESMGLKIGFRSSFNFWEGIF